jgi:hypothetical protein
MKEKDTRKTRQVNAIVDKRAKSCHDKTNHVLKDRKENVDNMDNGIHMSRRMLDDNA